MSGLPFIFLSEHWQDTVAAEHAELLRAPAVRCVDLPG